MQVKASVVLSVICGIRDATPPWGKFSGERSMNPVFVFLRDDDGTITIDRMEFTAAILTLAVVAAYAIVNGGSVYQASISNDIFTSAGNDGSATPVPTEAGSFQLTERVVLPVGSVAIRSDGRFTSFATPNGGWVDAWADGGKTVPEGARLTSVDTFTLDGGVTIDASSFSSSYSEAYSSDVEYAFK